MTSKFGTVGENTFSYLWEKSTGDYEDIGGLVGARVFYGAGFERVDEEGWVGRIELGEVG